VPIEAVTTDQRESVPSFTRRQEQVVKLLALGCTAEEAGAELGISARTVRAHVDVLRVKLGVARQRLIPSQYRRITGVDPLALDI
jgi:DNA-binding NarL/FixJ family response regulator